MTDSMGWDYEKKDPVTFQEVLDWAESWNKTLEASSFDQAVVVEHDEGLLFQHAATIEYRDQFLIVFSEHAAPRVFEISQVRTFATLDLQRP